MVNDLGVDPDDWFDTPHNDAEDDYITDEYAPCDVEYDLENPDESDDIEVSKELDSIHERMYQMAIKNGGSWLGGSENVHK